MYRHDLLEYVQQHYQIAPDFPWKKHSDYAVLRHPRHRKWFALVFPLEPHKLGLPPGPPLDVINVKTRPELSGSLRLQPGVFPAYHMNKEHWLSLTLTQGLADEAILALLDESFRLTF
ncbi:MmcQ/YjbR family DNA-binding protein [Candidatus Pantoea soli]|uniref:MmcQ protein n=1 Tax=Candidatus Pantoea soli TaxID=3098669 RepID=A0A518XI43_9GAMM|nr:MmcQ/YjbR family DNA-binding protein [Pantoea soli]QDY43873.1 MmcQ protein [Pantoea soli]